MTVRLLAVPKEVPLLRRAVRAHLGTAATCEVELCVSELVGNVIRHVGEGTPVTVHVRRTGDGRTRVEVTDPDPRALPVLLRAAVDDESGRGIALLDAVALRWGVRQEEARKTVWCEVAGESATA
ncbi:ATP-binding protein [Streptomyces noursei]|uniref:ATP-binding protein n=1 Tax=Streptomyces noursei TaxID=1971 RepID=UPI00081D058B|nr:Histidine kinase-like ATPase domain [Streptomyces noursei ATCC 11455]MCZ0994032.1 ATP-binding protein [Streptomyces noursei]